MKKFLQACEIGGSLYGKGKGASKGAGKRTRKKEDLMGSYKDFYKNQVNMMNKVFGQNK
jgi:hypothetical protein